MLAAPRGLLMDELKAVSMIVLLDDLMVVLMVALWVS